MPSTLDDKYLRAADGKLEAKLPDSYRRAMMIANGGEMATDSEDWHLTAPKKRLARTCNDVVAETANLAGWERFPRQAIAIANNGEGDQLLFLRLNDQFETTVYCCSHETEKLTKVAADFAQLERL